MTKINSPTIVRLLTWALEVVQEQRGALVGNPDPQPLADFDTQLNALATLINSIDQEHLVIYYAL